MSHEDGHRLLPRFRPRGLVAERARMERAQARALISALEEQPAEVLKHPLTKPGDAEQLRGIPALARGVGGVVPGTSPEAATVRKLMREHRFEDLAA